MKDQSGAKALIYRNNSPLPHVKMDAFVAPLSLSYQQQKRTALASAAEPRQSPKYAPVFRPRAPRYTPTVTIHACGRSVERGVEITRQRIIQGTRNGKTCRIRRWATKKDIDMEPHDDSRIDMWFVIQRDGNDYRVRAKTVTKMMRTCDRCACEYEAESDGRFDLVLQTEDGGTAEVLEAEEDFGRNVTSVDLSDHIRDAVYLGVPMKSLCAKNCPGVDVEIAKEVGSVKYSFDGAEKKDEQEEEGENMTHKVAREVLRELKLQMEAKT